MLIDTHAHLFWDSFQGDLDQVIKKAWEKEVKKIINVGTDLKTSQIAVEQIAKLAPLSAFASIGIHPEEINNNASDESIHKDIEELKKIYQSSAGKVVAIGECGLDYSFREPLPSSLPASKLKELQLKLFKAQIELAKKLSLPVVIHCRESWSDIFINELAGTKGVFHNFSGTKVDVLQALELGYYLAFSCVVTYPKNEDLRELVKSVPLDRILTETDSPFLPPQPFRGQRNEPAHVSQVVKTIAQTKGITFEEAATTTYNNALNLFTLIS